MKTYEEMTLAEKEEAFLKWTRAKKDITEAVRLYRNAIRRELRKDTHYRELLEEHRAAKSEIAYFEAMRSEIWYKICEVRQRVRNEVENNFSKEAVE